MSTYRLLTGLDSGGVRYEAGDLVSETALSANVLAGLLAQNALAPVSNFDQPRIGFNGGTFEALEDGSLALSPVGLATLGKILFTVKNGLAAALAAAANGGHVIVTDTQAVTSALTVPVGAVLEVKQGGLLSLGAGGSLTVNGKIAADRYQIFGGTLSAVTLGNNSCGRKYAEWWGGDPSLASDSAGVNLAAINAAIAAGGNAPLHLSGDKSTTWIAGGQVQAKTGMRLIGDGATLKLDKALSGTPAVIQGNGLSDMLIANLVLDGGASTFAETDRSHGAYFYNCTRLTLQDVTVQNCALNGMALNGTDILASHCTVQNSGRHGIWALTYTATPNKRFDVLDCKVLDWARSASGIWHGIVAQSNTVGVATGDNIAIIRNHTELQTGSTSAGSCIYVCGSQSGTDGHTYLSKHLRVDLNTAINAGLGNASWTGAAIEIAGNCPGVSASMNTIDGSLYVGLSYGSGTGSGLNDASIQGGVLALNMITNCGTQGMEIEGSGLLINANNCQHNGGHGIFVAGVNSAIGVFIAGTARHSVVANLCAFNGLNGICYANCPNTLFSANLCYNNSQAAAGFAGIGYEDISGIDTTGCAFLTNLCYDDQAVPTQAWGINAGASGTGQAAHGNRYAGNDCWGNIDGNLKLNAAPVTADTVAPGMGSAALAFASTLALDAASYDDFRVTLTGSVTGMTVAQSGDGSHIQIALTQDATGGRTVSWPASFQFAGGAAPTLSGASKTDIITMRYNFAAGKWREVSRSLAVA